MAVLPAAGQYALELMVRDKFGAFPENALLKQSIVVTVHVSVKSVLLIVSIPCEPLLLFLIIIEEKATYKGYDFRTQSQKRILNGTNMSVQLTVKNFIKVTTTFKFNLHEGLLRMSFCL